MAPLPQHRSRIRMGLIVLDTGRKLQHIRAGDIGRIGHDQIIFSQEREGRLQRVSSNAADSSAELVQGHIFLRNGQSVAAQVGQRYLCILDPACNGQANGAAAAAQIQNPWVRVKEQSLPNGQFRHCAGIIPGNQHLGIDMKRKPIKFPLAQNVGNGLLRQQTAQTVLHALYNGLGGIQIPVCKKLRLTFPGHVTNQHSGQHTRILGTFRSQQRTAGVLIQVAVFLYHLSAPSCSGRTAFTAVMATSIMESSGSLVVKFCIHIPGADRALVSQLSLRPHQRLIS